MSNVGNPRRERAGRGDKRRSDAKDEVGTRGGFSHGPEQGGESNT